VQIAKGLVVRSDERGYALVDKILTLFSDEVLGSDAAAALGVIAEENDRVLSKENFAVIRVSFLHARPSESTVCSKLYLTDTVHLYSISRVRSSCTSKDSSPGCYQKLWLDTKAPTRPCRRST
jgi:hypothetical protein